MAEPRVKHRAKHRAKHDGRVRRLLLPPQGWRTSPARGVVTKTVVCLGTFLFETGDQYSWPAVIATEDEHKSRETRQMAL